jgi:hypothetical protein
MFIEPVRMKLTPLKDCRPGWLHSVQCRFYSLDLLTGKFNKGEEITRQLIEESEDSEDPNENR